MSQVCMYVTDNVKVSWSHLPLAACHLLCNECELSSLGAYILLW